uniref:Putative sigma-70 region domain containing protein n=1 Tax=viral metagenome TaxID=1070528 RepID=A0A6M3MDS5_9ZZZZ
MTYINDETLRMQYVDENKSIKEIAKYADVTYVAIYRRLIRLGLYSKKEPVKLTPLNIEIDKNNTNPSTIAFIKRLELKEIEIGEPVKEFIERKYWDEGLSPKQIGELLNLKTGTVTSWMNRLGVQFRNKSKSLKLYLNKNPTAHQHSTQTFNDESIREKSYEANRKLRQGKTVEEICGVEEGKRLRKLYSEQRTGDKNPIFGTKRPQHVCDALSKAHKGIPQDPEFKIRRLKKAYEKMNLSPNKLETRIINIIEKYSLPFKFVGDGSMILHGFSPDFVSVDGSMKIIEVFGDYWHGPDNPKLAYVRTEEGRKKVFSHLGYDLLVLWESEINNSTDEILKDKICTFIDLHS